MHKRQRIQERDIQNTIDQLASHKKINDRVSSLAPYLAQIQRRKKLRELAKQSKKTLHQNSSLSFRIKDNKSYSTIQRDTLGITKDLKSSNPMSKMIQQRSQRQNRTRSLQRQRNFQNSKNLDHRQKVQSSKNNNFFNELYVRVKSKVQRQRPSQEKSHQTIECPRTRSQQAGTINIKKIGYTNAIEVRAESSNKAQRKGNFRRNKFQVSSIQVNKTQREKISEQMLSDSRLEIDKKQSNFSINKQMDKLAFRQMRQFGKLRNKEFHKSVAKSNEKYLSSESYRPPKSGNDIQVIINAAKNPSLHKVSHSTTDKPQGSPFRDIKAHAYDFDFPEDENTRKINVIGHEGTIEQGQEGFNSQIEYWQDGIE